MNKLLECPLCNVMACTEQKSIVCKGCCSIWYHERSMGMLDVHYDQSSGNAKSTWELPLCQVFSENMESNFQERTSRVHDSSSLKLAQLIDTLRHWEIEHAKNTEEHAENSLLTMAAEIGSSLLERVLQLEKENSILRQETASLSAVVEELRNEVHCVREREARLVETSDGINRQYDREKASRENLQQYFEEHDKKQEQLIADYQVKICKLEKTIEKLNEITNRESITENNRLPCDVINRPEYSSVNPNSDNEITNVLCNFKAMESRLFTLENLIKEDKTDILILKKTLAASCVEAQHNNTNHIKTCEQNNVLTQDPLEFQHVSDCSSRHHHEDITKALNVSLLVKKPSEMSLKPDSKLEELLNNQIDSYVAETIEINSSKEVETPSEKQNAEHTSESDQPCAVTYLEGKKYILGLNNKKKDKGILRQGCRIFINPFLNKS